MTTTTICVPVSLNRQFATQMQLLARSLRRNAALPGRWKLIFTVSRDASFGLDDASLAWAQRFPVEFRWVEQSLWDEFHWFGTSYQQSLYQFDTDAVLFMDADMIATGSLRDLVEQAAREDAYAAWPAWAPPPGVDWDEIGRQFGINEMPYGLEYSGYALDFMEPRYCPPYFNAGFVAMSGRLANDMARTYPEDFLKVMRSGPHYFSTQVALCINLIRNGYACRVLDMRYNTSNGDFEQPILFDCHEARDADARLRDLLGDVRILHYCVQSGEFRRDRDMVGMASVKRFCAQAGGHSGTRRLRAALNALFEARGVLAGIAGTARGLA